MVKRKTHEEFGRELREKQDDKYTLLGQYQNAKTKILAICNKCGSQYDRLPHDMLHGKCKGCMKKKLVTIRSKTEEEFALEVKNTKEYILIGNYVDSKTKCKIKHLKCGHIFDMRPAKFSYGQRCPKCRRPKHNRTHDMFLKEFNKVSNGEYVALGKFTRIDEKTLVKHIKCGYEYEVTPHKFINGGRRCPKCANNIKLTTEEFRKRVETLGNGEYVLLSEYKTNVEKVKIKHLTCGTIYETKAINFTIGRRCPACNSSKGETIIREYLIKNNYKFEEEYKFKECKLQRPLPFDFAVFKDNKIILIEYHGEQHYHSNNFFNYKNKRKRNKGFEYQLLRDKTKRNFCKQNNFKLIEVPYTIKNIPKYLERLLV